MAATTPTRSALCHFQQYGSLHPRLRETLARARRADAGSGDARSYQRGMTDGQDGVLFEVNRRRRSRRRPSDRSHGGRAGGRRPPGGPHSQLAHRPNFILLTVERGSHRPSVSHSCTRGKAGSHRMLRRSACDTTG